MTFKAVTPVFGHSTRVTFTWVQPAPAVTATGSSIEYDALDARTVSFVFRALADAVTTPPDEDTVDAGAFTVNVLLAAVGSEF